MQKAILILLLCISVPGYLFAQNGLAIYGQVQDSTGTPLPQATVCLFITKHDTLTTLTGKDGSFSFLLPGAAAFGLLVTIKGYMPCRQHFTPSLSARQYTLPPITLQTAYGELAPVTVLHIIPVKITQDTIEYHARAYSLRIGSELEELLRKLPGVSVGMDGAVTVQGKKISRVMVNGKDFPGDPLTIIRNLPAELIEMVQVIDDYGDKARLTGVRSDESEKILNVILKTENKNGILGKLELGTGNKNKYNAVLSTDIIHDDLQLTMEGWLRNISPTGDLYERGLYVSANHLYNTKWSDNAGFSIAGDNHSSVSSLTQDNFFPGNRTHLEQSNQTSGYSRTSSFSYTLLYKPDANSILRISSFLADHRNQQAINSNLSSLSADSGFTKTTTGDVLTAATGQSLIVDSKIYYEKTQPASRNRVSLEIGYHSMHGNQDGDNLSHTTIDAGGLQNLAQQYFGTLNHNTEQGLNVNLNDFLPLGTSGFLELGYEGHYAFTQNNQNATSTDSSHPAPVPVDSLSSNYMLRVMTHRLHAGYLFHSGKIDLTLSLSAQPAIQSGQTVGKDARQDYRYFVLLPLAQVSYSFSSSRKLNFEYSGNSTPPALQQLQPLTNLSNPQYPVTGNPSLKPSFSHILKWHYEQFSLKSRWLQGFGAELSYSQAQGLVIANLIHPHDSSSIIQSTHWVNANGTKSLGTDYHLDLPAILNKRLRIAATGGLFAASTPSMNDNTLVIANSWGWSQGLNIKTDLPDLLEMEWSGNYTNTTSRYAPDVPALSSPTANWAINIRLYLFKKWILNYTLWQSYTTGTGGKLFTNPATLNAAIEREFFCDNRAKISFSAFDLLNAAMGVDQSITATSITQTRTPLLGRYFQIMLLIKAQRFHK